MASTTQQGFLTVPAPTEPAPITADDEALEPDPGTEDDFVRDNNPFEFAPGHMGKLINPKSLGAFHALGGLVGLEKGLHTDRDTGLSVDDLETSKERIRIFADNRLPDRKSKTIFELMWMAYNDKILILLTVAAVIALSLGIYQAVAENTPEWIEGVAIIVAITIVVMVGAVNDFQKEKQFAKLNKKKDARDVRVCRSGKTQEISVHDLLVGDVLLVEPGDIIPADGIFISGHAVKCDESSATGESDLLKKTPGDEALHAINAREPLKKIDPFMLSGGKVVEGVGRMLVTAVGVNSSHGKTMMALRESNDMTPLQAKLNNLAEYIAKIGSAAALLLFLVLLIKFCAQLPGNNDTAADKGSHFVDIFIVAVTIIVVAVPEGLPLAVTLALAYATKRMLKDNNLVRVLRSCEIMGNATTVCSDKTGTLTQNVMTVVAGALGTSHRFSSRVESSVETPTSETKKSVQVSVEDVTTAELVPKLGESVKLLWKDSIAINSTAFEAESDGKQVYVGSKTETALLDFARDNLGMDRVNIERSNAEIAQMVPFDSGRKSMAMVIKLKDRKGYRLIVKGASEIVLGQCSRIISDPIVGIESTDMSSADKETLNELIDSYARRSLRTIGFMYQDFETESWPPRGMPRSEDDNTQAAFTTYPAGMIFLGIVGIQDPLRPGVTEAVKDCVMAGVFVRMVTGDNIITAKAIATECGIYTEGGLALEGQEFRKMTRAKQQAVIPNLQILARSSPEDKRTLVKRLKEMGNIVAVTGDGTNDAPALKAADVGFAMNIAGTEVAKEASDIILMDDNFASIVKALMWGRAVNDAVRKFLQFQITVNITAVLLAFISAVSNSKEQSVLTAVQLLWINLIMDTMAALALATDPPNRKILNRKPQLKSASLFSVTMWKMIIGQAVYQLIITLILYFAGRSILSGIFSNDETTAYRQHATLVFNTFTWMQIFNALNNRRLDNQYNVFEGLRQNMFFIGIFLVMIAGQVLIIFVGSWNVFQAQRQNGEMWAVALVLGLLSLPVGAIIRTIPDSFASKLCPQFIKNWTQKNRDKRNQIVITDEENPDAFGQALLEIEKELAFMKKYRGGRINSLKFTITHPKEIFSSSRSPSRSRASSTGAAMAGIVAGSIAGGWSPVGERREGGLSPVDRREGGFPQVVPEIEEPGKGLKGGS